jgi:hypothetical protein
MGYVRHESESKRIHPLKRTKTGFKPLVGKSKPTVAPAVKNGSKAKFGRFRGNSKARRVCAFGRNGPARE